MATLLSSLPIGASVKFGKHSINTEAAQPIIWVVADKNHSGYPANSVTLLAKNIIDLRAFDATEPNVYRKKGNFNYGLSNLNTWLNSDATANNWYAASHSEDVPPSDADTINKTGYQSRPGFLHHFASSEKDLLLATTITVQVQSDISRKITPKVFIPSLAEIGGTHFIDDGSSKLQFFESNSILCSMTQQAFANTTSQLKSSVYTENWYYWLRSTRSSTSQVMCIFPNSTGDSDPYDGSRGVRPIINIPDTVQVSEIVDSDGCYTLSITNAPSAPTNVQFSTSPIYTTKPCTVKWTASTDPNGDTVSYRVHLYYDGVETGAPIDVGTSTSYTLPSVKSGVTTIGFGIEAIDTRKHSSDITTVTGTTRVNNFPIISGSNSDLGIKTTEFSQTYTINDVDGEVATVTEYIDNVKIRSYVATLGVTNTFAVTGKTWLKLANGIHTLKITATDGLDESTRTYTFTKTVNTLVAQRTTPLTSTTKPSRLVVTVVKNIPPEATFKVEACNNGFDAIPVWEDITSSVTKGQAHVFSNAVKTAANWGVNIRVTVDRNGGEGACYITEIGGNFE